MRPPDQALVDSKIRLICDEQRLTPPLPFALCSHFNHYKDRLRVENNSLHFSEALQMKYPLSRLRISEKTRAQLLMLLKVASFPGWSSGRTRRKSRGSRVRCGTMSGKKLSSLTTNPARLVSCAPTRCRTGSHLSDASDAIDTEHCLGA